MGDDLTRRATCMAEENGDPTHTTTLLYKARGGVCKELQIVQPVRPGQIKLDFADIQMLGREIAKVLREDAE